MCNLDSSIRQMWAKTDRDNDQAYPTHPLICHLVDVSQVVCALWDHNFTAATRQFFAAAMGLKGEVARQWLAFLVGTHDLGKASPTFQGQYLRGKEMLEREGFNFPPAQKAPHGLVSAWALIRLLAERAGLSHQAARNVAVALGGHHGAWSTSHELNGLGPRQRGEGRWERARATLFTALGSILGVFEADPPRLSEDVETANTFFVLLAGLTSFADWIGSMSEFFHFVSTQVNLGTYVQDAYRQASGALDQLGWTGWSPPSEAASFTELFPFSPRPLQEAAVALAGRLPTPALAIVEAPTGEGKTEAAWYLADHWLQAGQQRGTYVAMPTQATSNQMLGRVCQFLERRYPDSRTNLLLLHGDAAWSEDMQRLRLATVDEDKRGTVTAHAWFLPKKRGLLAPFAVGTVDQALLAVLQTRHFFVRSYGLSHKTVIFDEIHAYDTYMNVLFQRLLRWLAAVGTSVILLSATLPTDTRRQLVEAYTGQPFDRDVEYPAIVWATSKGQSVVPLETAKPRTVWVEWLDNSPAALANELRRSLRDGGCAAVICNTVGRAQQVYRDLHEAEIVPAEHLILFHARFPLCWREEIEKEVLDHFGNNGSRPERAIVVATQVIEQSLDLDFDLIVTDPAPVDLILQRAGRLHRHQQDSRPGPLGRPRLLIIRPELDGDVPIWGGDRFVYPPYILLRSYLALDKRTEIMVPTEVQPLIEAVYGNNEGIHGHLSAAWQEALGRARAKLDDEVVEQAAVARRNLILPPDHKRLLRKENRMLEEDEPELHQTLQALTRLTRPSVTLVCLHQTAGGLTLDSGGEVHIDLDAAPDQETARELAHRKVRVSDWRVVKHFASQEPPPGWGDDVALRAYRPAIFTQGRCSLNGELTLILDRKVGLIIQREVP